MRLNLPVRLYVSNLLGSESQLILKIKDFNWLSKTMHML